MAVCSTIALPAPPPGGGAGASRSIEEKCRPLEKEIEVPVRCGRDLSNSRECPECRGHLLRDRPRRLAEPASQLERGRRPEVPEIAVRRVVQDERRQRRRFEGIQGGNHLGEVVAKARMNGQNHYSDTGWRSVDRGIVIRGRCVNSRCVAMICGWVRGAVGSQRPKAIAQSPGTFTLSVSWQDDVDVGGPIRAARGESALVESVTPAALRAASVAAEKY